MTDRVLSLLEELPEGSTGRRADAPVPDGWPAPPAPVAYYGLLGEIVGVIAPETEADPVAILSQLLVAFGAAVGRGSWFQVEATRHHPNGFLVLVGDSARARKDLSWDHVRRLITCADPTITARILTGLSSGEGLIWAVRDPNGQDRGVADRRPAGDRAGVRQRAQGHRPRDLHALADAALRVGRPAACDPDPPAGPGQTSTSSSPSRDPLAQQIHAALIHALPGWLTRTQLRDLYHRNPTTQQSRAARQGRAQRAAKRRH